MSLLILAILIKKCDISVPRMVFKLMIYLFSAAKRSSYNIKYVTNLHVA